MSMETDIRISYLKSMMWVLEREFHQPLHKAPSLIWPIFNPCYIVYTPNTATLSGKVVVYISPLLNHLSYLTLLAKPALARFGHHKCLMLHKKLFLTITLRIGRWGNMKSPTSSRTPPRCLVHYYALLRRYMIQVTGKTFMGWLVEVHIA